jgi:hypothetical protein
MTAKLVRGTVRLVLAFGLLLGLVFSANPALAAGSFKLKSSQANEVSGAWHLFVTVELPRSPATAHVPMKFLFTKTMADERALVDGHDQPVLNRIALVNQTPSVESLDVDFADGSGKIFKGTRFDFTLTRDRGYEAGEYQVQVRTTDGTNIGSAQRLALNGDNPVVDRRAITFNAKDNGVKKVDNGVDGGPTGPSTGDDTTSTQSSEVAATGTAAPFVSPDAYNKTPEEEVKTRPAGCCGVAGARGDWGPSAGAMFALGLAAMFARRKRG